MTYSLFYIESLVIGILHGLFEIRVVLNEVVSASSKPAYTTVLAFDQDDSVAVPNQDVLFELALLDVVVLMNLGVRKDRPEPVGAKCFCELIAFLEVAIPERVRCKNLVLQRLPDESV
jgi:hypothetical protein